MEIYSQVVNVFNQSINGSVFKALSNFFLPVLPFFANIDDLKNSRCAALDIFLSKFPYSVRRQENTDQKTPYSDTFSHSVR